MLSRVSPVSSLLVCRTRSGAALPAPPGHPVRISPSFWALFSSISRAGEGQRDIKRPQHLSVWGLISPYSTLEISFCLWKIRFALFKKNIAAAVYFNSTTVTPSSPSPYIPARKDLTDLFRFSISRTALRRIPAPRPWMI